MYYPDMGTECMAGEGPRVRAVGWLDAVHPYTRGQARRDFVVALHRQQRNAWQRSASGGFHECELCPKDKLARRGALNLWIPTAEYLFIAPELIHHYVTEHEYHPPEAFIEAVLACPLQHTPQFFERLQPFEEYYTYPTRKRRRAKGGGGK